MSLYSYHCLLLRLICRSHDGCAVGLTNPTQITHWLGDHYVGHNLSPDGAEGGIGNIMVSARKIS